MTRAVTGALLAVAAAGAIGALRQRSEQRRIAAGLEAPVYAATRTVPPAGEGRLARRLATWIPARPRSPLGRTAAALWAGPATLVGAVAAASTGGRWRRDEELGCWLVTGGSRGTAHVQRWLGMGANALGQVVVSRSEHPSHRLLVHEALHVRQAERLGPAIVPLYLVLWARYGYRDHPLERAARTAAALS